MRQVSEQFKEIQDEIIRPPLKLYFEYIKDIKALTIGVSSMKLGGGRETLEDTIDMSAGIVLAKKIGDFVKKGDVLCTIYTNKDEKTYNEIINEIYTAYSFSTEKVPHTSVIKEVIE